MLAIYRDTGDGFYLKDVFERRFGEDSEMNYATFRRTARGMQELGWLTRRSEKAQKWERGDFANLLVAQREFDYARAFELLDMEEVMGNPLLKELVFTVAVEDADSDIREELIEALDVDDEEFVEE
jgi:hypothetical protein